LLFPSFHRLLDAALLTTAAFFSFAFVAANALAPKDERSGVAVIFAPWTDAAQTLSRAIEPGGRFVRFGAFEFVAIVAPEAADYSVRARANGAWFIADPAALAACLKPFLKNRPSPL
jgi:hypothetical protein